MVSISCAKIAIKKEKPCWFAFFFVLLHATKKEKAIILRK
jgi:hypothetical protein